MLDAVRDRRLTAALRAGDRRAAEILVEETYRAIFGALFRLTGGDEDLAADLTQETYRRAWAGLAGFRGGSRFSTWLYRVAYTTFLNHVRRPRRVLPFPALPDGEEAAARAPDPAPDPEQAAGASAEAERLRRAVLALPEELRFTVTAHYWGERPVAEIARQESVTPPAIRKRLKKARQLLALALEEDAS